MRLLLVVLVLAASGVTAAEDTSVVETSAVIAAPVDKVWAALTTADGLTAWMVGQARIDLRVGGEMSTRYRKDGRLGDDETIVHTLVAFDREHLLVWQPRRAPAKFPFKAAWLRTTNLLYFTALPDGTTRVTDRMVGYDASEESQKLRSFFAAGNRQTLEALQKHFAR